MNSQPLVVAPDDALSLAAQMMVWAGVRHVPVVQEGRMVGLVSERDIAMHAASGSGKQPVTVAMTIGAHTCGPEDSVTELAGRMAAQKIDCLPVTERGALVGIVSITDVLAAQVQKAMQPPPEPGGVVGDIMTREPLTARVDDELFDAAAKMQARGIRHLPVVDGEGGVVGILSDRDLRTAIGDPMRALADEHVRGKIRALKVGDAMSREVTVTEPTSSWSDAAAQFVSLRAGAIPVVDGGRLVGIVSYVDVLRALLTT